MAAQNILLENTSRPLNGCPDGTLWLNTNSESCLAPCNNLKTLLSHLSSRRERLFPFQVYLNYSDESLMHRQRAGVTTLDGGEEQIKDLWCMYNEVLEGRLFFCLGQVFTHTRWWRAGWHFWRINICKKTIYGWIAVVFSFEEDFIKKCCTERCFSSADNP